MAGSWWAAGGQLVGSWWAAALTRHRPPTSSMAMVMSIFMLLKDWWAPSISFCRGTRGGGGGRSACAGAVTGGVAGADNQLLAVTSRTGQIRQTSAARQAQARPVQQLQAVGQSGRLPRLLPSGPQTGRSGRPARCTAGGCCPDPRPRPCRGSQQATGSGTSRPQVRGQQATGSEARGGKGVGVGVGGKVSRVLWGGQQGFFIDGMGSRFRKGAAQSEGWRGAGHVWCLLLLPGPTHLSSASRRASSRKRCSMAEMPLWVAS